MSLLNRHTLALGGWRRDEEGQILHPLQDHLTQCLVFLRSHSKHFKAFGVGMDIVHAVGDVGVSVCGLGSEEGGEHKASVR